MNSADVLDLGAGRGQTKRPLFAFYSPVVPSAGNVGVMIVVRGLRGAEGSRLRMLAILLWGKCDSGEGTRGAVDRNADFVMVRE
jgi:hypothetical protein